MCGEDRKDLLEIPRTQTHTYASALEVGDQFVEAGLGLLFDHGGGFDGPDGGLGFFLGRVGEGVDVVEDVGGFVDGEGGSRDWVEVGFGVAWEGKGKRKIPHLLEHVGLRFASED